MKLLLWDIDGTLLHSHGAGERALIAAMKERYDLDVSLENIDYRGRTDRYISKVILSMHQRPDGEQDIEQYTRAYLRHLENELPQKPGQVFPGIAEILETLNAREDFVNALLTGNLETGAKLKLEQHNLWRYFKFGAFADDSATRPELGPIALQRALKIFQREFDLEKVFIIGDTEHDIDVGKKIGAKTIAVCTGNFPAEYLAPFQPDYLFEDFSNTRAFYDAIGL